MMQTYQAEAREKWGKTDAYREFEAKTEGRSKQTWDALVKEMDDIMVEFSLCMKQGESPASSKAKSLVKKLQSHITEHYYLCTDEILPGLGQMYVADERFRNNIDKHAAGTAAFIREAIEGCCRK
ncbi:MAG: TipAS antibiotic-recognition domain-containing protein [Oscillospiraceae bacterium]|nr:TipAS antibiotic-recognition domain-containing protein [Oscillospiraceae bacterium]